MQVPDWLYGTAWKEEATEALVLAALDAGFRGIDTANQRKHYHEEGVGRALATRLGDGRLRRDQLFVQTKFTFQADQDERLPYDPAAPIAAQVAQSVASSQVHLGIERLDSLVLHGPSQRDGLGAADHEAWRAMEGLVDQGRVGVLGISNVTARQLTELLERARIRPRFVQNRCYADRGWDRQLRAICRQHGLTYQAFSLLTANQPVLALPSIAAIAARHGRTPAQVVFRYARQVGMLPLTGSRDRAHLHQALEIRDFELADDELAIVDAAGTR